MPDHLSYCPTDNAGKPCPAYGSDEPRPTDYAGKPCPICGSPPLADRPTDNAGKLCPACGSDEPRLRQLHLPFVVALE